VMARPHRGGRQLSECIVEPQVRVGMERLRERRREQTVERGLRLAGELTTIPATSP